MWSRMVYLIPTPNDMSASGVAQLYQDRIFSLHGNPDDNVSDRDTKFISAFVRQLPELFGNTLKMHCIPFSN